MTNICELGKSILRNNHDERLCITGEIFVSSYEQFNTTEVLQLSKKDLAGFLQETHQSAVWPFSFIIFIVILILVLQNQYYQED